MGKWQQRLLGDCLTLVSGGTPSKARNDFWGGDVPWVSCKDMKVQSITDAEDYLTPAGVAGGTRLVPEGTILFVVRGMILAKEFPVAMTRRTVAFNQDLKAVKPASFIDTRFLFHWFRANSYEILGRVDEAGHGTKRIQTDRLLSMPISVPELPVQRHLADILSAYDELIENSQRRILILETMARTLYREWFVHFRFPGHESVPRVASPLGEIPKSWNVVALDALKADQRYAINGGPFGSKLVSRDYVDAGVPVIRGSNLSESGRFDASEFVFVGEEKAEELYANVAVPGDIVITQRGTLGQIGMIPSGIGYMRFVISQSQMKVTLDPQAVNREYAFFFLRSDEAQQRIRNLASSSGVPHINLATLREFQILLPPRDLQRRFGEFALGSETGIEQLSRQIENLRQTRDLLLPRLLSAPVESSSADGSPAAARPSGALRGR
jgi:type I restriction enzyme S subunit